MKEPFPLLELLEKFKESNLLWQRCYSVNHIIYFMKSDDKILVDIIETTSSKPINLQF